MRKFISIISLLFLFVTTAAYSEMVDESKEERLSLHAVTKYCRYNNGDIIPQGGSSVSVSFTGFAGGWPGGTSLPSPVFAPLPDLFNKFDSVIPLPDYRREWFYPSGELDAGEQLAADMWRNNRKAQASAEYNKQSNGYQRARIEQMRSWVTADEPVSYERKRLLRVSTRLTVDGAPLQPQERIVTATIPAKDTHSSSVDLKPGSLRVKVNGVSIERPFTASYKEEVAVSLLPLEVVSRDRYLGGSITIPEDWNSLEMEFVGPGGENLGKYGELLGGGDTKILPRLDDILSDADYAAGFQSPDQKVWFVRNVSDPRKIDFYTCFASLGEAKIKLYLNGSTESFGEIDHSLTTDQGMAQWIDYTDQWIKGTMFPWYEDPGPPVLGRQGVTALAGPFDEMDNLTRAALIPVFLLVESVEGARALLNGFLDGIAAGAADDWMLGEAIVGLSVQSADWAISGASTQINLFVADPGWRAKVFCDATKHFAEQIILRPIEQAAEQLGYTTTEMFASWEDFKRVSFRLMAQAASTGVRITFMNAQIASTICGGVKGWFDDFSRRMMTGAEQASFTNTPWNGDPFFAGADAAATAMNYATGYIGGYVTEQIVVGMGVGSVAKVLTRGGLSLAGKLLARVEFAVGTRMHALKKIVQGAAAGMEFEAVVKRGLSRCGREGIPGPSPVVVSESLENLLRSPTFNRQGFNYKHLIEDLTGSPNIRKLTAIAGRESQFALRVAEIFTMLGKSATPQGLAGFRLLYERSLWFDGTGAFLRDHFDDLVRVFDPAHSVGRATRLNTALERYAGNLPNVDLNLKTYRWATLQDKAVPLAAAEHPEVKAFCERVDELWPEVNAQMRRQEGAAAARYEELEGKVLRRSDAGDTNHFAQVDFAEVPAAPYLIDAKGPLMVPSGKGEFFETSTRISAGVPNNGVDGLAKSVVKKLKANAALDPPVPTKVMLDLFGLSRQEQEAVLKQLEALAASEGIALTEDFLIIMF